MQTISEIPSVNGSTMTVDLLRHGQPDSDGCLAGHFDAALTVTGWEQLRKQMGQRTSYDLVVSSPLQRCSSFAQEYSKQNNLPLSIEDEWQEMGFGDWDGVPYKTLHERYPEALSNFWSDPWQHTPPNGETVAAFHQRIINAWQQLLDAYAGKSVLLVCHSGVIRQILADILGMNLRSNLSLSRFNIPHASLTRIEAYRDEQGKLWPRLMFLNGGHDSD